MVGILDNANRHLLTEENDNKSNSFIANVNKVASMIDEMPKLLKDWEQILKELNRKLGSMDDRIKQMESIRDDIDEALRQALLPVITNEVIERVVEAASDRAIILLQEQFMGNTDFVITYENIYDGAIASWDELKPLVNADFVKTYNDTYGVSN